MLLSKQDVNMTGTGVSLAAIHISSLMLLQNRTCIDSTGSLFSAIYVATSIMLLQNGTLITSALESLALNLVFPLPCCFKTEYAGLRSLLHVHLPSCLAKGRMLMQAGLSHCTSNNS
ncbi:hypothetical protein AVEN_167485-1 [Araneus ventricosus]|uniref:Uncharacterized protein n=1 Tax=Araneus ventricosus TaxID=182803 RepID=A0A4Y2IEI8_ARAVE|nr:hypothetical protein AVEN_167485-1 [Araneus ventricosus]